MSNLPSPRKAWPFKDMKVGDVIKFHDVFEWPKAVTAAHITGRQKGIKFATRWNRDLAFGQIWRTA